MPDQDAPNRYTQRYTSQKRYTAVLTVKEWDSKIQDAKALAKAENKPKTVFDTNRSGLHILARPSGKGVKTFWHLKYTLNGRPNLTSLGEYPTVSIKMARDKCHEAKQKIADGINPAEERRAEAMNQLIRILAEAAVKDILNDARNVSNQD